MGSGVRILICLHDVVLPVVIDGKTSKAVRILLDIECHNNPNLRVCGSNPDLLNISSRCVSYLFSCKHDNDVSIVIHIKIVMGT